MADNEIHLYGSVGGSWWDEEYFTAASVRRQLEAMSGDITVRINSGGGIATEGQAIYTMLVDYPGHVTVVVDGVAASAASLIAMAGDTIRMRLGAWMLIHDPAQMWTDGRGTEDEHTKTAQLLSVVGDAYAEIYAHRTGMSRAEARDLMRAETVMDGDRAVELGFADETDATDSAAVATFDYRIYAQAPRELREASKSLGKAPGKEAVLAMVAGIAGSKRKEPSMADKTPSAAEAKAAATPATQPAASPAPAPEAQAPVAAAADAATILAAERARTRRITDAVTAAGLEASFAATLIDEGVGVEAALDRITTAWKEKGDAAGPMAGRDTARIVRDERETRAMAMTDALASQMGRAKPETEAARQFMGASIIDMAAQAVDWRGGTRTTADRLRVIEAAFHSTSDFPAVFENALNKRLQAAYAMSQPVYMQIAARMDFTDFRPHPMVGVGEFPLLERVNETGEIKFGTVGDKKETVVLLPYAVGMRISRQMVVNDDLGAIERVVRNQGMTVARSEEATFFSMMLSGTGTDGPTLLETGRQVFNTTDKTKASAGAAISVASVGAGRAEIRKHKSIDGNDLALNPSILLTGPDKEVEAEQLVASITANDTVKVNPFSGRLTPIGTPKITGNAWYLLPDPDVQALFMYGYLQGEEGPRLRMDEPFGSQGIAYTVERDFGCGAIDWRGGWKNPGA